MKGLNYPPHFTFAIYDEIDPSILQTATKQVFQNQSSIIITFDQIAYFDAEEFVLWASPQNKSELVEFHKAIHAIVPPELCREYYQPEIWVPHCTLGFKIKPKNKEKAQQMIGKITPSFEVEFDYADCVEFLPVKIIEEHALL